jgi:hypothetical protein
MGDIVRSVVVIGVILLGLWGFGKLFTTTPEQTVSSVDYQQVVDDVRSSSDVEILAPPSLPDGWRATSARYEPGSDGTTGTWNLGVLTDDDEYLGLEQSSSSVRRAVDRWAEGGQDAGSAQVAGRVWSVVAGPDDRTTYVTREDDRTTLVTGTVEPDQLESYISSLR